MDQLTIVSVDSHAQAPPDVWAHYLEKRYHEHLLRCREDNEIYSSVMTTLAGFMVWSPENIAAYDTEGAYADNGFLGLWDLDRRLFEMDREGIAGEFLYQGDQRVINLFTDVFGSRYDIEVCEAGVRAFHRWLADTFGSSERLFLVGQGGTGSDLSLTLSELEWVAEHGFAGTFLPGVLAVPGVPPYFHDYWEPVWELCESADLPLFVHGGFGLPYGQMVNAVRKIKSAMDASTNPGLAAAQMAAQVFPADFFADIRARRPMWQMMLGGVFDRHPGLRLVMTEMRADWLPATLRALDEVYIAHREDLPGKCSPTEYWHTHCLTCPSFVHRSEVAMRHEIGIETVAFGRDYPHNESTWPNTKAWLQDAFQGVPENEVRLILGENAIRFLHLDRSALAAAARRVGPTLDELIGNQPPVESGLIAHFDLRGGYLKPPEGDAQLPEVMDRVQEDLLAVGGPRVAGLV